MGAGGATGCVNGGGRLPGFAGLGAGTIATLLISVRLRSQDNLDGPRDEDDDYVEGDFPPGDELAIEGVGRGSQSGDDGPTELSAPQSKAMFPSSFGMSFSVELDAKALKVTPRWGIYDKEPSEFLTTKTGAPRRIWERQPCGNEPHEIPLVAGPVGPIMADAAFPDAKIRGLIRRRSDHWSVTLFLVNDGYEPKPPNRERSWMFQCELEVEAPDGSPIFHKRLNRIDLPGTDEAFKQENDMLAMLYRRHVEFVVGHGVAVHADVDPTDTSRAVKVSSRAIPNYEVPKTTPPTTDDAEQNPAFAKLAGLVLDMKELCETKQADLRKKLEPLTVAYREWIDLEKAKISNPGEGLAPFQRVANKTISHCERTLRRIEEGIDLVGSDQQVCEAFLFMNRAMWWQRTRSLFSEQVRRRPNEDVDYNTIDISENRSWYPFQLAFILLNLPGIAKLDHPERSESPDAVADLLWFPTGGGKTEAYLGLTAFTLGIRRLQGTVEGRSGDEGVAVLMRYKVPSDIKIYSAPDGDEYLRVGDLIPISREGAPQLPMKTFVVKLNRDSKVLGVRVEGQFMRIKETHRIIPASKGGNKDGRSYYPDEEIYALEEFFPGKLVRYDLGKDNTYNYAFVRFYPAQYIPKQGKLAIVTEAKIILYYEEGEAQKLEPLQDSEATDSEKIKIAEGEFPATEAQCIIICPESVKPAAERLSEFHKREGISSAEVTVESIGVAYSPAEDPPFEGYVNPELKDWDKIVNYDYALAKKIIAYLRDMSVHPHLEYVTIIGDSGLVPASYLYWKGEWGATDLFYVFSAHLGLVFCLFLLSWSELVDRCGFATGVVVW